MSRTGNILLVSGYSNQARIIQKFQCKADPVAGVWNHSGILFETANDLYVVEMAPIHGRKFKAACRITSVMNYTQHIKDGLKLLELVPKFEFNETVFEGLLLSLTGTPYDYWSLLHDQVIRTLGGDWVGRKGNRAARRMVCHEFAQYVWNEYCVERDLHWPVPMFREWYKGDVALIYHNQNFTYQQFRG